MAGPSEHREAFSASLVALQAEIAATESRGAPVPAEAHEMVQRLREVVEALDGLTASIERRPAAGEPPRGATDGGATS